MGEVFARGTDTAGNYHWFDTDDGHHVIPKVTFQPVITKMCENCQNNPKNGGTGICHYTLGTSVIY